MEPRILLAFALIIANPMYIEFSHSVPPFADGLVEIRPRFAGETGPSNAVETQWARRQARILFVLAIVLGDRINTEPAYGLRTFRYRLVELLAH